VDQQIGASLMILGVAFPLPLQELSDVHVCNSGEP
jgi:hypothetical protein